MAQNLGSWWPEKSSISMPFQTILTGKGETMNCLTFKHLGIFVCNLL